VNLQYVYCEKALVIMFRLFQETKTNWPFISEKNDFLTENVKTKFNRIFVTVPLHI
jgi:hypothetical protein